MLNGISCRCVCEVNGRDALCLIKTKLLDSWDNNGADGGSGGARALSKMCITATESVSQSVSLMVCIQIDADTSNYISFNCTQQMFTKWDNI